MKTLIANIGLVKRLKSSVSPKAKQRAIAVLLAVATLLTALVVLPVTLPVTEVGAGTLADLGGYGANMSDPGAFSKADTSQTVKWEGGDPVVFYANEWGATKWKPSGSSDAYYATHGHAWSFFGDEQRTNVKDNGETAQNAYHTTEKAFYLKANGADPYVFFRPVATPNRVAYIQDQPTLGLGARKYIAVTYTVYNPTSANKSNVNMRIYPLNDAGNLASSQSYIDQPITTNSASDNNTRFYETVIFDMSTCEDWSGAEAGIRIDYFDNGKNSTSYKDMTIFIDSIGFFYTLDEAKMHERERDWARNGKNMRYDESHNDRNIFRASDGNLQGYFLDDASGSAMTVKGYDPSENAFLLQTTPGAADPHIHFVLTDASSGVDGNKNYKPKNRCKRHFSGAYTYIAIRMKITGGTPDESTGFVDIGSNGIRLFGYTGPELNVSSTALPAATNESYKQQGGTYYVEPNKYVTYVFKTSGLVRGFRFNPMAASNNSFEIYIDSIGFFTHQAEALNLGKEIINLDADELCDYIGSTTKKVHKIIASNGNIEGDNTIKLVTDSSLSCGHAPTIDSDGDGTNDTSPCSILATDRDRKDDYVIDPYIQLTLPNGGIRVSEHRYMVVEYYVPQDSSFEGELKKDNGTLKDVAPLYNATGIDESLRKYVKQAPAPYSEQGYLELSFFPSGYSRESGERIRSAEVNRSNFKITTDRQGQRVRVLVPLNISEAREKDDGSIEIIPADVITDIRIDPFNEHVVWSGAVMHIRTIGFYENLSQIEGFDEDKYPFSFSLTIDDGIEDTSSYSALFASNLQLNYSEQLADEDEDGSVEWTVTLYEDFRFYRHNYEFVGWRFECDGESTLLKQAADGTYTVKLTINTSTDNHSGTTANETKLYSKAATLTAVWRLQTGLLTVTQDADGILKTSDRMIYTISGTKMDSVVSGEFAPLNTTAIDTDSTDGMDNINVRLPVGIYSVSCQDGWNWRYNTTKADVTIEPLETYSYNNEGALVIQQNESGNQKTANVDFTGVKNNKWLNGYGYAAIDVAAASS
jgi:hypothetical protein